MRGTELESGKSTSIDGHALVFKLSWNDTDTQFEWGDSGDAGRPADSHSLLIPRSFRGRDQPSRFMLIVEKGSARFEGLVLEES